MKKWGEVAALAAMMTVALMTSGESRAAGEGAMQAEMDAIHQFTEEWTRSYNAGDLDAVLNGFSADAKMLEDGQPMIMGPENIRAFWERQIVDSAGSTLYLTPMETRVSSDSSFAYSLGRMKVTVPGDSGPMTVYQGKYLDTLVKEDGQWKWEIGIINSDVPMAE